VVVTHEAKRTALSEDRSVIVDGAVAEAKREARGDMIPVDKLGDVTSRDPGALEGFERQKAVSGSLRVTDRNRVGIEICG